MVAWYPGEDPANSSIGCPGLDCVPEIKGANTGTGRTNSSYAPGKVGHAFQFSTNNGSALTQVNVPDSPSLRLTNGLTIEAWINPNAPGAADNPILVKGNLSSAGSQPYSILFVNAGAGDNRIIFRVGNNSTFDSAVSSNVPLNVFTHIAVTYDGTTMSIFVNGELDGAKTTAIGTLNQNNLPLSIGGGSSDFSGAVDEVKIYNRALSQPEIQGIVNAVPGTCRSGSNFPALPTYDAAADFSVWSNASLLNGGVWSYGSAATLNAGFLAYSNAQASVAGGAFSNGLIDAWDAGPNTAPGVFHNTSNNNQVYSGTVNHPANSISLQPGSYSFVRWTAPTTGGYLLQGQFVGIDSSPTSADVYIIRNYGAGSQSTYFSGFITAANGTAPFNINFAASAGDTIDLVVGPGTNGGTGETNPANDSTGVAATIVKLNNNGPTAADSTVSGQITSSDGTPLGGAAILMNGTQNRLTITDASGHYNFNGVETNGIYTITPALENYTFSPAQRSFSSLGQHTEATFTGIRNGGKLNPLEQTGYFVRQQYLDFLGREPDEKGFTFWLNNIESCGANQDCRAAKRVDTSAAFFLSIEFQQTGFLVHRLYKASYGDLMNVSGSVPIITFSEFLQGRQEIGQVIVGQAGWENTLEQRKQAFILGFIQTNRFVAAFPLSMTPNQFVDHLFANTGIAPSSLDRAEAINEFGRAVTTNDLAARTRALLRVAGNEGFTRNESAKAFVLAEYFGYLRRNPNDTPDWDYSGYHFWLTKLDSFNGNFVTAEMVKAFINSGEYRQRFLQ